MKDEEKLGKFSHEKRLKTMSVACDNIAKEMEEWGMWSDQWVELAKEYIFIYECYKKEELDRITLNQKQ